MQLQRLVTTGALPCSKEEAASLAAIQLRLQECLPSIKLPSSKFLSHQSCHNNSSNPNQNNNQVGPLFLFSIFFFYLLVGPSLFWQMRPSLFLFLANGSCRVLSPVCPTARAAGNYNKTGRYRARSDCSRRKRPAASSSGRRRQQQQQGRRRRHWRRCCGHRHRQCLYECVRRPLVR